MNSKLKQRSDSPRSASIPSVLFYGLFHPTTIFVHHIYSPKIYVLMTAICWFARHVAGASFLGLTVKFAG